MSILIKLLFDALILSPLGRVYLWKRYRKKSKIQDVLQRDFNGDYSNAGAMMFYELFGIFFILMIALLIIGTIYSVIKFGIGN